MPARRGTAGFTLVEVLVAALVVAVGILATLGALASGDRLTGSAKRTEQATAVAQRTLSAIKALPYAQVGLTSKPVHATTGPYVNVTGTNFTTPGRTAEALVDGGTVPSAPESFTSGTTTGTIYRFVTTRSECSVSALGVCLDQMASKRVTVAVWLSPDRGRRPPPTYVTTLITNPDEGPLGVTQTAPTANPGSGALVSAQPFYLYDTRCSDTTTPRPAPAAHATHDTTGTACSGSTAPDLLGAAAPPATVTPPATEPPLPDLSTDLTRTAASGVALQRTGTGCPTTGKFATHTWMSAPLPAAFAVVGRSALSLNTRTVGGAPADVTLCVTLKMRSIGVPPLDVTSTIASTTYHLSSWPTTTTPVGFTFDNTAISVPALAAGRLILTVAVKAESGADVELLFDHPDAASVLSVSTTSPFST